MRMPPAWIGLVAVSLGCAETGQDRTRVPLFVAGTDVSDPVVAVADIPITIERADLAFGPLYLCAGVNAGDLCETARLEWLDTVVVDTAAAEPALAGELTGITGPVQSWMYDLGISSQLIRSDPYILDAANELGDVSFVLEGRATVEDIEIPFSASVPIQQTVDTELGVPVVRKSTSEAFFRDVSTNESGLVVRFDPSAWVQRLDVRPYVSREGCTEGGPDLVCDGGLEQTCDGEMTQSSRDCRDLGQVCIPEEGCTEQLIIPDGSEAYRSLRNALVSGGRPSFEWDQVP